jgi:predicted ferric reductase
MMAAASKSRLIWIAMILVCCSPLAVWLASVNSPLAYVRLNGLPPGQQLYLLAKLAGLFALCLFWLQCLLALATRAPLLAGFPAATPRLHIRLGATTAVLIFGHVVLFIAAASARTGHIAWEWLLPNFTHGDYKFNVGLGALAFWLVGLTVFAGWRTARGQRRWKVVHLLWPVVFGLAFLHAFAIGTESRYGAMRYLLIFIAVSVVLAGIARIPHARKDHAANSPVLHPLPGVDRSKGSSHV